MTSPRRAPALISVTLIAASLLTLSACPGKKPATPPAQTNQTAGQTTRTTAQTPAPKQADTLTAATSPLNKQPTEAVKAPRRVILLIGDGMGASALTAAAYAKGAPLEILKMPRVALMRTHEHEFLTTDSAASATAFSTGEKTHFEGVSVKPGTTKAQEEDAALHLKTMVQQAREAGWKTGLIATSRITHATPAAFASHRAHRGSYEAIAADMAASGVDVLLGAGSQFFDKDSRQDKQDLLGAMKGKGYTIATSAVGVQKAAASSTTKKLVGLLHPKDMPSVLAGGRKMALADMLKAAIEVLDRDNPEGYFLMVEGSQIDWEEHNLNGIGTVAETVDFDDAVGVARKYAAGRDDTLVVVAADHETGGLTVVDGPSMTGPLALLGGEDAALKASSFPARKDGQTPQAPDAIHHLLLGNHSTKDEDPKLLSVLEKVRRGQGGIGPDAVDDPHALLTFGYLSLASRPEWRGEPGRFISTHTASMVPLMAEGAGADAVAQVHDNADLGRLIQRFIAASKTKETFTAPKPMIGKPKNVILLIGDGMGVAPMTAAYYAAGDLSMLSMPVQGLVATHGYDRLVNDSAATATALATGHRARYHHVGMRGTADGAEPAETVLEAAESSGRRTGLVTTTTLTHATPAAFYAHHTDRTKEDQLAAFFIDMPERVKGSNGVDVAFAGGAKFFTDAQKAALVKRGVKVETGWTDTPAPAGQQIVRLLNERGLPGATIRHADGEASTPTLAAMTKSALATLAGEPEDGEDKGFFLMVEGGQIDWQLHGMANGQSLVNEVIDFDQAVAEALTFAARRGDTLVIVTADHDHTMSLLDNHYGFANGQCGAAKRCGGKVPFHEIPVAASIARGEGFGATALQGQSGAPKIVIQYAWPVQAAAQVKRLSAPHAATFVPLFAFGPNAQTFGGFHEQPELGKLLLAWARGE